MIKNVPQSFNSISCDTARKVNGGATYVCKHCGYKSTNYWKVYANALACVSRKYGRTVLSISSRILG